MTRTKVPATADFLNPEYLFYEIEGTPYVATLERDVKPDEDDLVAVLQNGELIVEDYKGQDFVGVITIY